MSFDTKKYLKQLKNADENNDDLFHELLNIGIKFLNLSDRVIRHTFGISQPTLERWKKGKNRPHPAMRRVVFRTLRDLCKR